MNWSFDSAQHNTVTGAKYNRTLNESDLYHSSLLVDPASCLILVSQIVGQSVNMYFLMGFNVKSTSLMLIITLHVKIFDFNASSFKFNSFTRYRVAPQYLWAIASRTTGGHEKL